MRRFRSILVVSLTMGGLIPAFCPAEIAKSAPASQPVDRPAIAGRRIVKHFDFNEGPLGNFGSLPMLWQRHAGLGFPAYLEGKFDPAVGHAASPSFRLDLDGASIAYH